MPELPDIAAYLDALGARYQGQTLERLRVGSPFLVRSYDPPVKAVEGKTVRGFRRIGKRVVFELSDELFIVVHLMVAGRFKLRKPGAAVPRKLGLCAFDFAEETLMLTEASKKKRASLHVVAGEEGLAAIDPGGMEVMGCGVKAFAEALRARNHTLKRSLTDPHVFSGIGNAYSDEILHHAKLSPVKWTGRLSDEEVERLYASTQHILEIWMARLRAEAAEAFPAKVTAFRPEMAVHGKFKDPCPVCETTVQRIVRGESEVNYCPGCQTGGKLLADRSLSRLLRGDWPKTLEELEERKEAMRSEVASAPPAKGKRGANKGKAKAKKAGSSLTDRIASLNRRPAVTEDRPAKPKPKRKKKAKSESAKKAPKGKTRILFLFAPGAGAPSTSDWMTGWAERLEELGKVHRFDYDYMAAGKRRPDRHDKLVAAHRAAFDEARKGHRGPVVLIGKSMGSRIGCHLTVEEDIYADAIVCFGYPLVGMGKTRKVRDEILRALKTPVLFIQGTRDKLCPLEKLEEVRPEMSADNALTIVETGDHSLLATKTWLKTEGKTQDDVDRSILAAIDRFLTMRIT